jgi:predicted dehydrogenase
MPIPTPDQPQSDATNTTDATSTAQPTRREFVKTSAAAALLASSGLAGRAYASGSDEIRVGVVGVGGRGTGACGNSLSSSSGVSLVAIGDLTHEIASRARTNLKNVQAIADRVNVPDDNIFAGLDAYKKVINHPDVDLVILTTSPGFRPMHLAEAVKAGKHVFMEKPVCVDPAGYRSVLKSGEIAAAQNTAIVAGTMFRRQDNYMGAIRLIHDGAIGMPIGGTARYCSGGIWFRKRRPSMTDLEYQLYNWYHFVWLGGDQVVEQAVHNIDAIVWAMGSPPATAFGTGGQFTRPAGSEIYDNLNVDLAWENGANISFKCRQIPGAKSTVTNTIMGTKGIAFVNPGGSRVVTHSGEVLYEKKHNGPYPYVLEHTHLIESIRGGDVLNEAKQVADSSLTAVMARMAAYTGQEANWNFVANESRLKLMPDVVNDDTPVFEPRVRIPGKEKMV